MRGEAFGVFLAILLLVTLCVCDEGVCNRRPLGTTTAPLTPDNRYQIEIVDIKDNVYKPKQTYDVRLFSQENAASFIAFSIFIKPDTNYNDENPRKPIILSPGSLEVHPEFKDIVTRSPGCNDTIMQSDISPKKDVKVKWMAPDNGNKCVTILAMVLVQPDVWYNPEGALSKRICGQTV